MKRCGFLHTTRRCTFAGYTEGSGCGGARSGGAGADGLRCWLSLACASKALRGPLTASSHWPPGPLRYPGRLIAFVGFTQT